MDLVILGMNHKTAPLDQREQLAFSKDQVPLALEGLVADTPLAEVVLLNTCNRVEIIGAADLNANKEIFSELRHFLLQFHQVKADSFVPKLYQKSGMKAVRHLFEVAASLDSMVLGEPQILGQVKEAYRLAHEHKKVGGFLEHCFAHSFRTAKRVRNETEIAKSALSISHVAIDLARRIFGKLEKSTVLLVGAGKMGQQAATRLKQSGAHDVVVINRSYEKAVSLAETHGWQVRAFGDLEFLLPRVDIVVVSTDARNYVLREEHVRSIASARRYRPLFIVDISVPRNVDPKAHNAQGVFLYDIDNLEEISAQNRKARARELSDAEGIVDEELQKFKAWEGGQAIQPLIAELVKLAEQIRHAEIERSMKKFGEVTPEMQSHIDQMTKAIVKKLLHHPIRALKSDSIADPSLDPTELFRRIFNLNNDNH